MLILTGRFFSPLHFRERVEGGEGWGGREEESDVRRDIDWLPPTPTPTDTCIPGEVGAFDQGLNLQPFSAQAYALTSQQHWLGPNSFC